jgi:hypothetical protein
MVVLSGNFSEQSVIIPACEEIPGDGVTGKRLTIFSMNLIIRASIVLLVVLICSDMEAYAFDRDKLNLTFGADYSTGDYGGSGTTDIYYFPVSLKYDDGANIYRLTVPFIVIDGPKNVVYASGRPLVIRPRSRVGSDSESGLGDVLVSGTFNLRPETETQPLLDLTVTAKVPTADEDDGLGTGEFDFSVQLDLAKAKGPDALFGSVGYLVLGDPPGTDLDNVFFGSIGWDHQLDQKMSGGLVLDLQESAIPGDFERAELSVFLNTEIENKRKLLAYVTLGLADGSPDWGIGVAITFGR